MKKISWREVFGNPLLTSLDSRMLNPEGYQILKSTKINGESKKTPVDVAITYDREYVLAVIISKIIEPLRISSYNELQQIISSAWNEYKRQKKK